MLLITGKLGAQMSTVLPEHLTPDHSSKGLNLLFGLLLLCIDGYLCNRCFLNQSRSKILFWNGEGAADWAEKDAMAAGHLLVHVQWPGWNICAHSFPRDPTVYCFVWLAYLESCKSSLESINKICAVILPSP